MIKKCAIRLILPLAFIMYTTGSCFAGNNQTKNPVDINERVDEILNKVVSLDSARTKELNKVRDSLISLYKRLQDYEAFKAESRIYDSAVWDFGSSIVGILTGVIILFGIVYYLSSKQAARDAFDSKFENYSSVIKSKITEAQLALDKLNSRVEIIDEAEEKIDESSKNIEDAYK